MRDTQFSVSFVLSLLAATSLDQIEDMYGSSITKAVPEVLNAAADAANIRSPSSFTLAERVAELRIPTRRYDSLLKHYGMNGQKIQAGRANEKAISSSATIASNARSNRPCCFAVAATSQAWNSTGSS